jgi:hypothetical protein
MQWTVVPKIYNIKYTEPNTVQSVRPVSNLRNYIVHRTLYLFEKKMLERK